MTDVQDDQELIRRALTATVTGPYFPDSEFHTLFGLTRDEMQLVLDAWPKVPTPQIEGYDGGAQVQRTAVNNALNNLLGYPHGHDDQLIRDVGATKPEIALVLGRWRGEDFDSTPSGYFNRLM